MERLTQRMPESILTRNDTYAKAVGMTRNGMINYLCVVGLETVQTASPELSTRIARVLAGLEEGGIL